MDRKQFECGLAQLKTKHAVESLKFSDGRTWEEHHIMWVKRNSKPLDWDKEKAKSRYDELAYRLADRDKQ